MGGASEMESQAISVRQTLV